MNSPLLAKAQNEAATFLSVFAATITLQEVDTMVSIAAGLIACAAGLWALWDRWRKKKAPPV